MPFLPPDYLGGFVPAGFLGSPAGTPPSGEAGPFLPPSYFGGFVPGIFLGGAGLPGPATPSAVDLLDAVEAYLIAILVPGLATWVGAGKLPPGPGYGLPFVIVGDPDSTRDYQEDGSGHAPYDDHGSLPVRVIAGTRSGAKALARAVGEGLTDAALAFDDGELLQIRLGPHGAPVLEDEHAPAGEQAWVAHLMFTTIVSKTL